MKTILVCAQKGGVGKTTIADELAFSLDRAKLSYNFYDLDAQGGCTHEKQEFDDAEYSIVDTPGALQEDMVGWMKSSDLIIIPTRPSMRDIPPLQTMIEIVSDNKITVPVIFVVNGWNRFKASSDFMEWFTAEYSSFNVASLVQSEDFVKAAAAGKSVYDIHSSTYLPKLQMSNLLKMVNKMLNTSDFV